MSLDVFFQGFIAGESAQSGGLQMREALARYVVEMDGSFLRIRVGDGHADIYLSDDGMMANHITGIDPWNLLVQGARSANWVILPMGGPTCVTGPGQREELPDGLGEEVVLVTSGAELLALIAHTNHTPD
jgi:hypothetical protein